MFREMRRSRQQLTREEAEAVLSQGHLRGPCLSWETKATPYGVPLSYVYHDGKLYFHWARSGHKLDAVRACPKASFCVVDQDQVVSREYTTYFRSAIAFGTRPNRGGSEGTAERPAPAGPAVRPSSPRPTTSGRSTAFLQPVHRGADGPAPHREGGHRAGPGKGPRHALN